jgi:hypothetical protein
MPDQSIRSQDQNEEKPIRSKDGRELPDNMNQALRDAVWAGLANKLQRDKELLCKQYGHEWVDGPENTTVCKRCRAIKQPDDETGESSITEE